MKNENDNSTPTIEPPKTTKVSTSVSSSAIPAATTSGIKRIRDSIPKSSHDNDAEFVAVKDRIKAIVECFDDIKKIDPADIEYTQSICHMALYKVYIV